MFEKIGVSEANEIINWKYKDIYSYYDIEEHEKEYLYKTNYYSSWDEKGVSGFFCTGYEATIDTECEFNYDDEYLDIAFGLRPDLCGKGLGEDYVRSVMEYLYKEKDCKSFRLTVGSFNSRAIKIYKKLGFKILKRVISKYDGKEFIIMLFDMEKVD